MNAPHALVERLRAATGASRELDALIEVEARRQDAYRAGLNDEQRAKWRSGTNGVVTDGSTTYFSYTFTASVDAALALVERCLPGSDWKIERLSEQEFGASVNEFMGYAAPTAPLALLIALLTALSEPNHE